MMKIGEYDSEFLTHEDELYGLQCGWSSESEHRGGITGIQFLCGISPSFWESLGFKQSYRKKFRIRKVPAFLSFRDTESYTSLGASSLPMNYDEEFFTDHFLKRMDPPIIGPRWEGGSGLPGAAIPPRRFIPAPPPPSPDEYLGHAVFWNPSEFLCISKKEQEREYLRAIHDAFVRHDLLVFPFSPQRAHQESQQRECFSHLTFFIDSKIPDSLKKLIS